MKTLMNPYLATLLLTMTAQSALAERLVDPTRPANARPVVDAPKAQGGIRLEAILRSGGAHLAIVNGKIVRAGDQVGAVRIDAVLPDGIRYTSEGRSHTARLESKAIPVRRNVVPNEDET